MPDPNSKQEAFEKERKLFSEHAKPYESIDAPLRDFTAQHGFSIELNAYQRPCRVLRRGKNPKYAIEIFEEGSWLRIPHRDDLPHTIAVAGYLTDRHTEYYYQKHENVAYFEHFSTIKNNLDQYLTKALQLIEEWTAEKLFREGGQSRHPADDTRFRAAAGFCSQELHELLFAIWQLLQATKGMLNAPTSPGVAPAPVADLTVVQAALEQIEYEVNKMPESNFKEDFKQALLFPGNIPEPFASLQSPQVDRTQALKLLYVWSGMFWHHASEISRSFPDIEGGPFSVDQIHILLDCVGWPRKRRTPRAIMHQAQEELAQLLPSR